MEKTGAAAQTRFTSYQKLTYSVSQTTLNAAVLMNVGMLTGSMDSLTVKIPPEARLVDVSGVYVKDWSSPDDDGTMLINLMKEISESFSINLNLRMDGASSQNNEFTVPEIDVPGAVEETGTIIIAPAPEITIWTEKYSGLEETGLPRGIPLSSKVFDFKQPGWELTISRRPVPRRLRSEAVILYEVTDEFMKIKTRHRLTVTGRGVFETVFEVPEGYDLREAGPANLVAGYRQIDNRVEINFRGEQTAPMDLELLLQKKRASGEDVVSLDPIRVKDAEEDAGNIVLAAPRALKAMEIKAEGLEAVDVRTLVRRIQPFKSPDVDPVLAYRYFSPDYKALASIEKQRTKVTCQTARLVSIMPSLMRQVATLDYNVEFSATDTFQVLVPASAGEDVKIEGPDIKEKTHASFDKKTLVNGELTTWTIRLQRRIIGKYTLTVSFDSPLPVSDSGKEALLEVPTVRAADVARETGFIAVSRGENLEVRIAESNGLESRDVKELPRQLSSAYLGFRYFEPKKQSLRLELIRHQMGTVLGAIIRRLHIETVLNDQREAVYEIIFEIQNNREQYLELALPEGMEIWSAFVKGAPVRPITRKSDNASLIELTKSRTIESAFRVRLVLRQTLPGGDLGKSGELKFFPPAPLNIPVQRTSWKIYLPRDYEYYNFSGTMKLEVGGEPSWVEPAAETLLNDIPASLAGGVARPSNEAPVVKPDLGYDSAETEQEKQARLQASALEIPIVREGMQFVFSKISGVGEIRMDYRKKKQMLALQAIVALIVFAIALGFSKLGKKPGIAFIITLLFFIAASLTAGSAGRYFTSGLAGAGFAFGVSLIVYISRKAGKSRMKSTEETIDSDVE